MMPAFTSDVVGLLYPLATDIGPAAGCAAAAFSRLSASF